MASLEAPDRRMPNAAGSTPQEHNGKGAPNNAARTTARGPRPPTQRRIVASERNALISPAATSPINNQNAVSRQTDQMLCRRSAGIIDSDNIDLGGTLALGSALTLTMNATSYRVQNGAFDSGFRTDAADSGNQPERRRRAEAKAAVIPRNSNAMEVGSGTAVMLSTSVVAAMLSPRGRPEGPPRAGLAAE